MNEKAEEIITILKQKNIPLGKTIQVDKWLTIELDMDDTHRREIAKRDEVIGIMRSLGYKCFPSRLTTLYVSGKKHTFDLDKSITFLVE